MTGRLHNVQFAVTALVALLAALVLLGPLAFAAPGAAATRGAALSNPNDRAVTGGFVPQKNAGTIVEVNKDISVPFGTTASNVVAFGGSITVAGTVSHVVAGLGADVKLLPSARVGTASTAADSSLIVIGGSLTKAPGAAVTGKTTANSLGSVRDAFTTGFWRPIASPFRGLSLIGWAGSTVLFVLIGLLVAAVLPRQTRAARNRFATHFPSSLGWGALTALIIVPVVTLALVITIVGILLAVPFVAIVVPAVFLFGYVAAGAFIGRGLSSLLGYRGHSLMLTVTIGLVAAQLVRLIPYAGAAIVAVLWIAGGGAAIAAFFSWNRARRRLSAAPPLQAEDPADQQGLRAA
jgi:hypothetical protein